MPGHGTSIEGMLATAREALPGTEIPRLLLPEKKGDPVFIYQRFPEDKTPAGRTFTTLDPDTGAVLSVGSSSHEKKGGGHYHGHHHRTTHAT